jgi:hypothetical protein
VQTPLSHVSAVHLFPVSHGVPVRGVWTQLPVAGSQLSWVHSLLSLQFFGVPPWQTPFEQVSPTRHLFVEHVFPFLLVSGTQVATPPTSAHFSHSLQVLTGPGLQVPFWQVSPRVQTSPSEHGVSLATFLQVPVVGSQT